MKIKIASIIAATILYGGSIHAQSTTSANLYTGSDYLGYDGSNFTSPLLFKTNLTDRMQINGNTTAAVPAPAPTANTDGFLGININDPWSRLHIGGQNLNAYGGYRPWMGEGITLQNANDQMWMGLVQWGFSVDEQNATMNWGDDGADHFVFSCTNSTYGNPYSPFSPASTTSLKGREVMRLTDLGFVGIGPNFDNTSNAPQSPLHINGENSVPTYLQVTNGSTGQTTPTDGFAFGITSGGTAEVIQYEAQSMTFKINSFSHGMTNAMDIEPIRARVGINNATPHNRLEITSRSTDPGAGNAGSFGGSSGLRLTNLKAATTPTISNPGNGVLSVDGNGDVVYVDGNSQANNGTSISGGFVQLGELAGSSSGLATLLNAREIPMAGKRIFFSGNNWSDGVTIGANSPLSSSPPAKFEVRSYEVIGTSPMAIYAEAVSNGANNIGIRAFTAGNVGNYTSFGVQGLTQDARIQYGVYGEAGNNPSAHSPGSEGFSIGVKGSAAVSDLVYHFGVVGHALNSTNYNLGGEFIGRCTAATFTGLSYGCAGSADYGAKAVGVSGSASDSPIIYGVYGEVDGAANLILHPFSQNRAVYGKTYGVSGTLGGDNYAGYFDGDVFINGITFCTGGYMPSDLKLKHDIDTITDALSIIKKLEPRTYLYDTANAYKLNLPSTKQYGFISQDVFKILPELTTDVNKAPEYDSTGKVVTPGTTLKGLNYNGFFAILMKGIQEQQSKIDSLVKVTTKQDSTNKAMQTRQDSIVRSQQTMQTQMDALARQIQECCAKQTGSINGNKQNQYDGPDTDVNLNNKDIIVLEQNVPNPFAEQTVINYNIPNTVTKAQIIFYNSTGNIIQTVDIKTRGRGKVNVFASDLSSGLYNYTLVADGKVIDSKKMVRE